MNRRVEFALLALLRQAFPKDFEHFADAFGTAAIDDLREFSVTDALSAVVVEADIDDCEDRFALVQALVLGVRVEVTDAAEALSSVADKVLEAIGADHTRRSSLVSTATGLHDGVRLDRSDQAGFFESQPILDDLEYAFAPYLTAEVSVAAVNHIAFAGKAAATAAMITEATALYETTCSPEWTRDPDLNKDVTHVQIELCTSLPFDECSRRIDPSRWPECNPYFNYVKKLEANGSAQDWFGRIQEDVGPGLNYSYYKTDLKVRYIEQPGIAAAAFDLVPTSQQTGDHRVTVDRGFLAVIDEGVHRRVQMVKVYRIEDQTGAASVPHEWVCPLWAQQMTLAGWSCGATAPMRKALKVWSEVMHDMVAITRCACGALHCDCEEPKKKSKSGKAKKVKLSKAASSLVMPLSPEQYDVPLPSACMASFTDTTAETCIAVPAAKMAAATAGAVQVVKAEFGQSFLPPHDAQITPMVGADALLVALGQREKGLFLGHLNDAATGVAVPFTIYDTGL